MQIVNGYVDSDVGKKTQYSQLISKVDAQKITKFLIPKHLLINHSIIPIKCRDEIEDAD